MNLASLSNASIMSLQARAVGCLAQTSATVSPVACQPTWWAWTLTIPGYRSPGPWFESCELHATNPVRGAGGANLGITDNRAILFKVTIGALLSSASCRAGRNYHVKIRKPVFHGELHRHQPPVNTGGEPLGRTILGALKTSASRIEGEHDSGLCAPMLPWPVPVDARAAHPLT